MNEFTDTGLTLRDYFAAAALQGMLAAVQREVPPHLPKTYAADAYAYAAAMLLERKQK